MTRDSHTDSSVAFDGDDEVQLRHRLVRTDRSNKLLAWFNPAQATGPAM
jgi:hypothetical protein